MSQLTIILTLTYHTLTMLFSSYEFIFIFLPITFFTYSYLKFKRVIEASKCFLTFSSHLVYSWRNAANLPIILTLMILNHTIRSSLNNVEKNKNKVRVESDNLIHSYGEYFAIP